MPNFVDNSDRMGLTNNDERNSFTSVTEMKVSRGDVGYADPIARKNRVDNRFFFMSKNASIVSPDELDKWATKPNLLLWERSGVKWFESAEGQAAIKAVIDGTYEYNDPKHDYLWDTKSGMLALGVDERVVAFYNEVYKRLRPRPDFTNIYTPANFGVFWSNPDTCSLMTEMACEWHGYDEDTIKGVLDTIKDSNNPNYDNNLNVVREWYVNGGCRTFGAIHYAQTIIMVRDKVAQFKTYDELLANVTPDFFINMGIATDEAHVAFEKHNQRISAWYNAIEPAFRGAINGPLVAVGQEFAQNGSKVFVDNMFKSERKYQDAAKVAPVLTTEQVLRGIVYDEDATELLSTVMIDGEIRTLTFTKDQYLNLLDSFPDTYVCYDEASKSMAFNCIDEATAKAWSVAFYDNLPKMTKTFRQVFNLTELTRTGYLYREGYGTEKNIASERYETNEHGGKDLVFKGELLEFCGIAGITYGSTKALFARTAFANAVYDTFRDIENVFGVKTADVFGTLGIGYGSSGSGKELAHHLYENGKHSINMNYKNGYGSLGHELIHCIDSELGKRIMDSTGLSYTSEHPMITENYKSHNAEWRQTVKDNFPATAQVIDLMLDTKSEYYKVSARIDSLSTLKEAYWTSPCEMLARAGAIYIENKFAEKGFRNDFLSGNSHYEAINGEGVVVKPIPNAEEQAKFNECMDAFFAEMKEKGIIKDVPDLNLDSLYKQRNPDKPDKYNIIVTTETSPLYHNLQKESRIAKTSDPKVKITEFSPDDIKDASLFVSMAQPKSPKGIVDVIHNSFDVDRIKSIVETKMPDGTKDTYFEFSGRADESPAYRA